MSEYQYYEFQAIDRPLTAKEMSVLRRYSTRARISPTRFVNDYAWGDFGGDENSWMERYFDAFLYFANWGTHVLQLRLPAGKLGMGDARRYCVGESATVRKKGAHVVLRFASDEEGGGGWDHEGDAKGRLSSMVAVRAALAGGDLRALYLGWLACAQSGELDDGEREPPVPPGLGKLGAPLEAMATFLRIDPDLLAVAATVSAGPRGPTRVQTTRTVGALMAEAEGQQTQREEREARTAAAAKVRRERAVAAARVKRLAGLAGKESKLWTDVDTLVATKEPKNYDTAVALLVDLRDLMVRGNGDDYEVRLRALRDRNVTKAAFLKRLAKVGLSARAMRRSRTPLGAASLANPDPR